MCTLFLDAGPRTAVGFRAGSQNRAGFSSSSDPRTCTRAGHLCRAGQGDVGEDCTVCRGAGEKQGLWPLSLAGTHPAGACEVGVAVVEAGQAAVGATG